MAFKDDISSQNQILLCFFQNRDRDVYSGDQNDKVPDGDTRTQKAAIMNKEKTVALSLLCYHGQQGKGAVPCGCHSLQRICTV